MHLILTRAVAKDSVGMSSVVFRCAGSGVLRFRPDSLFSFQVGLLDIELNQLTKALFLALVALSVVMVALQGFAGPWYRNLFRFLLLFSYIIPIR